MEPDTDTRPAARPILVAVDFSASSEAALAWAATEASVHDAPLIVLHVVHDPVDAPGYYRKTGRELVGDGNDEDSEPMGRIAERYLSEFLDSCRARNSELRALPDVDTQLVAGLPATRILEVAAACDARLIVMGSRGRTGLKHLLVGSKAERVVQLSPIPVTIVKVARPGDDDESRSDAE